MTWNTSAAPFSYRAPENDIKGAFAIACGAKCEPTPKKWESSGFPVPPRSLLLCPGMAAGGQSPLVRPGWTTACCVGDYALAAQQLQDCPVGVLQSGVLEACHVGVVLRHGVRSLGELDYCAFAAASFKYVDIFTWASCRADSAGILPSIFSMFGLAPFSRRISTIFQLSLIAATCRGVL